MAWAALHEDKNDSFGARGDDGRYDLADAVTTSAWRASRDLAGPHDPFTMSDETVYEPATFRAVTVRTIRRGRWTRRASYSMRLFAAAELCQWMLDAGFATAEAFRGDGEALSPDSRRMIVLARTAP